MPQVELEMDALALLRLEARKDGDDLSACVRRLILDSRGKKGSKRITIEQIRVPQHLTPESLATSYPTAILRFMCVLGWLCKKHGADFAMVLHYTGRGRTYFARNPQAILDGGNSTNPKRIPDSEFWVCTNLSNKIKGQILDGVMTILGYATLERRAWSNAVEGDDSADGSFDRECVEGDPDDPDDLRI
jgi:negative modulator of initiation of replication